MPESPAVNETETKTKSKAEAVAEIARMREQIKKAAESQFSGAAPAATATMMLDMTEAERLHPEKKIRWVSLRNEQKAQMRQASGYVRLSAEEGGRQVGNLVLMALPRAEYERRIAEIKKINQDRLTIHNKEAEGIAEGLARELRDKHHIDVSAEQIYGRLAGDPRR